MSALNLDAPLTVLPDVSIQDTLKLLHREGFDQVPVVDEAGYVLQHRLCLFTLSNCHFVMSGPLVTRLFAHAHSHT